MKTFIIVAIALTLSGGAALADPAPAPPKPIGPCAGIYASVAGLTDYRFDGFSESDREPTWQATAYCYRADGFFAGATFTGIDFEDTPRTHVEADWYVGRQFQTHGFTTTIDLLYASFPDKRSPGPSYDLLEPQIAVTRRFQRLTLGALAGWETDVSGSGREWHLTATAAYALTPWLSLSGHAGRFLASSGADHDHDHWDVGATAAWRRLTLDARYGGTDQPLSQCFYTNWCKPGAYASLSYRLLP